MSGALLSAFLLPEARHARAASGRPHMNDIVEPRRSSPTQVPRTYVALLHARRATFTTMEAPSGAPCSTGGTANQSKTLLASAHSQRDLITAGAPA